VLQVTQQTDLADAAWGRRHTAEAEAAAVRAMVGCLTAIRWPNQICMQCASLQPACSINLRNIA
jgi:hypothetical protein